MPQGGAPCANRPSHLSGDFALILVNYGSPETPASADQAVQQLSRPGVPLGDPKAALTESQCMQGWATRPRQS